MFNELLLDAQAAKNTKSNNFLEGSRVQRGKFQGETVVHQENEGF